MSTFARFGALMAPFVPLLVRFKITCFLLTRFSKLFLLLQSSIHSSVPMILFGLVSVTSGVLICSLPETLNCKLPETVEEAINNSKVAKKQSLIDAL